MENLLKDSYYKPVLIGKIKGLSAESKKSRIKILESKNHKIACKRALDKYTIGIDIRYHLLAYAFLRRIPYHNVERNCGKNNLPKAEKILKIVESHVPEFFLFRAFPKFYKITLEDISSWLNTENKTS